MIGSCLYAFRVEVLSTFFEQSLYQSRKGNEQIFEDPKFNMSTFLKNSSQEQNFALTQTRITQLYQEITGGSYGSSPLEKVIGIGQNERIAYLKITWRDGHEQILINH